MTQTRKRRSRGKSIIPVVTLGEAPNLIRDVNQPPLVHIAAAMILAEHGREGDLISLDDLVECVRRGGVAAEIGARALNTRLGRRSDPEITVEDIIVDADYWVTYIRNRDALL